MDDETARLVGQVSAALAAVREAYDVLATRINANLGASPADLTDLQGAMTSLSEVVTSVRLDPVVPADGTESVDGSNVSVESGTADAPPAPDPGTPPDPNAGTPDVVEVVASDSASAEDTHQ